MAEPPQAELETDPEAALEIVGEVAEVTPAADVSVVSVDAEAANEGEAQPTAEGEAQPDAEEQPATAGSAAAVGENGVEDGSPLPAAEEAEDESLAAASKAIALHEQESEEVRRLAEATAHATHSGARPGEPSAEEAAVAAEGAEFEARLGSLEEQLADVRRHAPAGRQSWGGAQAPDPAAYRVHRK